MTRPYLSDPQRSRAVLIGVHAHSERSDLKPIEAVERNLTGLADALADPEIWGLPSGHIAPVPQPATDGEILDHVMEAGGQATDTLLVYYAGHGLADPHDEKELYLALPGSRNHRPAPAFRYRNLRNYLASPEMKADKAVVILDCCFSGLALLGPMSATEELADLAAVPGRCVLTASAATKLAMAPPGETYTAFTSVLLKLLTDGVPGGPELLDMETLFEEAHAELQAQSRPLPQLGSQGSPGLICIAKNRSEHTIPVSQDGSPHHPPMPLPSPRRPKGVPLRMPALVRQCLLEPPQPSNLSVLPRNYSDTYIISKARTVHYLKKDESLIAVWEFEPSPYFSSKASSLVFTSHGIRIFQRRFLVIFGSEQRHFIPYSEFHKYQFSWHKGRSLVPSGMNTGYYVDTYRLSIDGPVQWGCTREKDFSITYMAEKLNHIKSIAVG